jgi:hypothetical protein
MHPKEKCLANNIYIYILLAKHFTKMLILIRSGERNFRGKFSKLNRRINYKTYHVNQTASVV